MSFSAGDISTNCTIIDEKVLKYLSGLCDMWRILCETQVFRLWISIYIQQDIADYNISMSLIPA